MLYDKTIGWAESQNHATDVIRALKRTRYDPPDDFVTHQGWVLIAFQNAFYQLLNAQSFEEALVDTIHRGGDTDTNAAICGELLGAVHGRVAIPWRWVDTVLA